MKRLTCITAALVLWGAPADAQTCTRDALKTVAASYFQAVEKDDMSALVTAPAVRITENAVEVRKGEGFFKTGGKALFRRTIVDTATCSTLTQAVVEETTGTADESRSAPSATRSMPINAPCGSASSRADAMIAPTAENMCWTAD